MNKKYYRCYSLKLKEFIVSNGLLPIDQQYSKKVNRNVWLFMKTDRFVELLEEYQEVNSKE